MIYSLPTVSLSLSLSPLSHENLSRNAEKRLPRPSDNYNEPIKLFRFGFKHEQFRERLSTLNNREGEGKKGESKFWKMMCTFITEWPTVSKQNYLNYFYEKDSFKWWIIKSFQI